MSNISEHLDPEIAAISSVHAALHGLEKPAQLRVMKYVASKLELALFSERPERSSPNPSASIDNDTRATPEAEPEVVEDTEADDLLAGVSPVAKKWIQRNGLNSAVLSAVFSLGVDEIDVVAKKVPGKSKKDRMRSVFLLQGVAAYLSGGVARFGHKRVREVCTHYGAWDTDNFATYFKSFSSEISGNKESGYALTSRGLVEATELLKGMHPAAETRT